MAQIAQLLTTFGYGKIAIIVVIIGIFVDISPIKFNPIKSVFKYIGRAFNSSIELEISNFKVETNEKLEELREEQNKQQGTLDKLILDQSNKEISRWRWEIIDFKNSIVNGTKHSRGQYRHVLSAVDAYINAMEMDEMSDDDYCREVFEDGEFIREHYEKYKDDTNILYF